jgi:hypothetical protein
MKLVSLNTWGAGQGQIFFDYIKTLGQTAHIFCFQEVFSAGKGAPQISHGWRMFLLDELKNILPDFTAYFEAKSSGFADDSLQKVSWPVSHGMTVFVKNSLGVKRYLVKIIADSVLEGAPPVEGLVKAQVFKIDSPRGEFNLINFHGLSRPGDKLDTPARIEQSQELLNIAGALPKLPVIICGDFNLELETTSIKMLERHYINLIREYKVDNTRNEVSWKLFDQKQHFADFIFVSSEIRVNSFEVPYNEISDHLPMILQFDI